MENPQGSMGVKMRIVERIPTVREWIDTKQLKAANIARPGSNRPKWIVQRADLDMFLKTRQPEPKQPKRRTHRERDPDVIEFF